MGSPLVVGRNGHPDYPEKAIIGWIRINPEVISPAVERVVVTGTRRQCGWRANGTRGIRGNTPGNHHRTGICRAQVTERQTDFTRRVARYDSVGVVTRGIRDVTRLRYCWVGPGCWPAICGDVVPANSDAAIDTDGMGCDQLAAAPDGAEKTTISTIHGLPARTRCSRGRIRPCSHGLKACDHRWSRRDIPNGHHFVEVVIEGTDSVENRCCFPEHFSVLNRDDLVILKRAGVRGAAGKNRCGWQNNTGCRSPCIIRKAKHIATDDIAILVVAKPRIVQPAVHTTNR